MNVLLTLTAALILGQSPSGWSGSAQEFAGAADTLRSAIVQKGYQKIGVVSRLTVTIDAEDRKKLAESLGPQELVLAELLRTSLAERSSGQFQVLEGREQAIALYDLKPEEMGNRQRLQEVADKLGGMDALVYGVVTGGESETGSAGRRFPQLNVLCSLVDVKEASQVAEARQSLKLSVAGAAYIGESFELRRWEGRQLKNVGLHKGTGIHWVSATDFQTQGKYDDICRERKHPLDNYECPFRLSVLVDGQPRQVVYMNRQAYVTLDMGETFAVRAENQSGRDVYAAVFLDGINILGKKLEHAANCRYWHLAAGTTGEFSGWYSEAGSQYKEEAFKIAAAGQGPAAEHGRFAKLGQITAVFYTVGMPRLEQDYVKKTIRVPGRQKPPPPPIRRPDGSWAYSTPAEPEQDRTAVVPGKVAYVDLEMHAGEPPGLILAAMTLRRVTPAEMQTLKDKNNWAMSDEGTLRGDIEEDQDADGKVRFGATPQQTARSEQFGGVEVAHVIPNSPGTNLRRGGKRYWLVPGRDIITRVDGERVTSEKEFRDAIKRSPAYTVIRVYDTQTGSQLDYDVQLWD